MHGSEPETVKVALQEKMAASTHSRKPEQAATPGSSWSPDHPPSSDACISIRLWPASGTAASALPFAGNETPAVCLVLDLIAASGGVPVARRVDGLVAGFPSFQAAVLAARRLQWAVQGFSETGDPQAACLAVLVHSPEDAGGGDFLMPGDQAAPGEILLTEKASQLFENLPGFPLQPATGDGPRELLWRAPESQSTRAFDEQFLSQLVERQGVQSQPPEPLALPKAEFAANAGTRTLKQLGSVPAAWRSRRVIGGVAVAAVVLVAAAVLYTSHGKANPASEQSQPQTQLPGQTAPAAANEPEAQGGQSPQARTAHSAEVATQASARSAKNAPKGVAKGSEAQAAENPLPAKAAEPPSARGGRCDLEPSQYSGLIDQAWKNLGRGKYSDAKREFGAVLACDGGNARAREGMERARMAASEAEGQP